eukprot:762674-Rhodomonas_salina.1
MAGAVFVSCFATMYTPRGSPPCEHVPHVSTSYMSARATRQHAEHVMHIVFVVEHVTNTLCCTGDCKLSLLVPQPLTVTHLHHVRTMCWKRHFHCILQRCSVQLLCSSGAPPEPFRPVLCGGTSLAAGLAGTGREDLLAETWADRHEEERAQIMA